MDPSLQVGLRNYCIFFTSNHIHYGNLAFFTLQCSSFFVNLFIYLFIYSFIYLFIYLFISITLFILKRISVEMIRKTCHGKYEL